MVRFLAKLYFLTLGFSAILWWLSMYIEPEIMKLFALYPDRPESIFSFFSADFLMVILLGFLLSFLIHRSSPLASPLSLFLAGGITYATLFLIHHYLRTGAGFWSVLLMAPGAVGCCAFSYLLRGNLAQEY